MVSKAIYSSLISYSENQLRAVLETVYAEGSALAQETYLGLITLDDEVIALVKVLLLLVAPAEEAE